MATDKSLAKPSMLKSPPAQQRLTLLSMGSTSLPQRPKVDYVAWSHPIQKEMLAVLKKDGLGELMKRIIKLDSGSWAPEPHLSRLTVTPEADLRGLLLLASVDREVLEAVLDNTLPQKYYAHHRFTRKVLQMNECYKDVDPGLYVNYLAKKDGTGLTKTEFRRLLLGLGAIFGTSVAQAKQAGLNPDVLMSDINRKAGRQIFPPQNLSSMQIKAEQFFQINLERLEDDTVDHIPLGAEVGWASNLKKRGEQHANLQSSPPLYVLVNCLLQSLWPGKFTMHQFVIFTAFEPSDAFVGEPLLSVLAASYWRFGGFNWVQAGKSVEKARTLVDWQWGEVHNTAMDRGILDRMERNLKVEVELLETAIARTELEVQVERLEKELESVRKLAAEEEYEIVRASGELELQIMRATATIDDLHSQLELPPEVKRELPSYLEVLRNADELVTQIMAKTQ